MKSRGRGNGSTTTVAGKAEEIEAKKRAKREANRRSAQLSRARKKAFIEDLKQQNQDYQRCEHILASHPDIIFGFNANGMIDFANRAAAVNLGYPDASHFMNRCFFDFLEAKESRPRFQSVLEDTLKSTTTSQAIIEFDHPLDLLVSSSEERQRYFPFDIVAQCTREESQQWTIVCAARPPDDISLQKETKTSSSSSASSFSNKDHHDDDLEERSRRRTTPEERTHNDDSMDDDTPPLTEKTT